MSVTVAEDGNKRVGGPSLSETRQCVLDIKSWFEKSKDWSSSWNDGATSADFQRLEKTCGTQLPRSLDCLLTECNGMVWFQDKEGFDINRIVDSLLEYESTAWWKAGLVPFAGDGSTLLVIDAKNGNEDVYEWEIGESEGDKLASTFGGYLESYRDQLLGGGCEYIDGCGVVESMGATRK